MKAKATPQHLKSIQAGQSSIQESIKKGLSYKGISYPLSSVFTRHLKPCFFNTINRNRILCHEVGNSVGYLSALLSLSSVMETVTCLIQLKLQKQHDVMLENIRALSTLGHSIESKFMTSLIQLKQLNQYYRTHVAFYSFLSFSLQCHYHMKAQLIDL